MHHSCPVRLAVLAALAALALSGCGEQQQSRAASRPPPTVTVRTPTKKTVVDHDEYVGRFVAVNSVQVRARVSGTLEAVHFKDGQMVKKGDLLFTIDRRPFQNTLDEARANLALARSNLTYARADLARAKKLIGQKTITDQTFEQRVQAESNAEAQVAAQQAAVQQAELNLSFTQVRSPIDGRIGDRRVSPGNLVTGGTNPSTTLLTTIVSVNPIRFEFTFDEAAFLRYERMAHTRKGKPTDDVASRGGSTPVALKLMDEKDFVHHGRMDFVDNVIDRSTGTIRGRAVFANPNGLFIPGMFARIRVPASPPYQALLVPDVAIGSEQARKFVYVVNADNVATERYVTLGPLYRGERIVKDGLKLDDRVMINGMARIRPGIKVKPQAPNTPSGGPGMAKAT